MTLSDFKWQQNFKRHGVLGENIFVATMQVSFSVQESPRERCKSYSHWVTVTNRKPNTVYRMVPFSITSNDSKPNFQSWLLHYNRPANISELSSGSYPSFTVSLPFPSPRPIPPFTISLFFLSLSLAILIPPLAPSHKSSYRGPGERCKFPQRVRQSSPPPPNALWRNGCQTGLRALQICIIYNDGQDPTLSLRLCVVLTDNMCSQGYFVNETKSLTTILDHCYLRCVALWFAPK